MRRGCAVRRQEVPFLHASPAFASVLHLEHQAVLPVCSNALKHSLDTLFEAEDWFGNASFASRLLGKHMMQ